MKINYQFVTGLSSVCINIASACINTDSVFWTEKIEENEKKITDNKNAIDTNEQAIEDLGFKLDNNACMKECFGVEDNWQQYGNSGGYVEGIKYYINCNFSQNILKPFVLII